MRNSNEKKKKRTHLEHVNSSETARGNVCDNIHDGMRIVFGWIYKKPFYE